MPESRKWIVVSAGLALFAGLASAQVGGMPGGGFPQGYSTFACSVTNGGSPSIRAEGFTELTGDIVITCSGGALLPSNTGIAIPTATITVFLNTTVTSRLLSNTSTASEALLLVDEPGSQFLSGYGPTVPQTPCATPAIGAEPGGCTEYIGVSTLSGGVAGVPVQSVSSQTACTAASPCTPGANVFQGITSQNQVTFNGIPVMPPATSGDTRVYRITNIRVNANGIMFGGATPGSVNASLSINASTPLAISNSTLTTAFVQQGLSPTNTGFRNTANTASSSGASFSQCSSPSITSTSSSSGAVGVLQFAENFADAFKVRGSLAQNVPGTIFNSESGFTAISVTGTTAAEYAGYADYGTRLKATFSNVPSGVSLYVTTRDVTNDFNASNAMGYATAQAVLVLSETALDSGPLNPLSMTNSGAGVPTASQTTTYGLIPSIPLSPVTINQSTGSGVAVWEVINTNPNQLDTIDFGLYASYSASSGVGPGYITVTLSYAPTPNGGAFNSSGGAAPSSSLTVPRFSDSLDTTRTVAGIASCTNQPLSITGPSSLSVATVGAAYAYAGVAGAATGGTGLYHWSATGLPAGLSMALDGLISGTPTTNAGSPFTVIVTVTDTNSATASKSYTLTIDPALSITSPSTLPGGVANAAYTPTKLTATGGSGSYTWSATGLPAGLSIAPSTGVISGTPTTNNTSSIIFNVEVIVTDSNSVTATAFQTYNLAIYPSGSRPQSPVVTQQAEVLTGPRSSTQQPLLFSYVVSANGFDTEIAISNTSQDTLGSTPQSGGCSLYFYGSNAPAQNPQTTPQISAGTQFAFRLSQGGSGIPAIPNFNGYVIANCGFPLARGFANTFGGTIGFAQNAQLITRPRGSAKPVALLFPFVTNQSGYDTGITIANTSLDPFGTQVTSGTCGLYFYGYPAPATQPFVTPTIGAGSVYANLASQLAPGFQGYAIADCNFSNAASFAFVLDAGAREIALSEVPQLLTLPRNTASQPLLFSNVTNQNGYDTQITIANTSADPFGTVSAFGSCTLSFYGPNAPSSVTTLNLLSGTVLTNLVSQMAPGFAGYIAASCFPQAQGWAYTGLSTGYGSFLVDGDSDMGELVTLPRSASASTLLFPAISNWNGEDTNITISNTSADPFGTTPGSGTCTISYFGEMLSGGAIPTPQVSSAIPAGSQLSFTLSQGNVAQDIAGAPGFRGYVIAACSFPVARGLATITGNPPGDTVDVTVSASPAVPAITITVDGATYAPPQTFTWLAGSTHTIGATVATNGGTQYAFANWSSGGRLSQSITAPASSAAFTANFQASQYSSCDLRQTGGITVADVQLIINEALGVAPVVYDLSGSGAANVVDVQIEINAALGLGCSGQ